MIDGLRMGDWAPSELPPASRKAAPVKTRAFAGAQLGRYTDFQTTLEAPHREIQKDIDKLRAHSRDLARNNAYARRYASLVVNHVVGPTGISFESEIVGNLNRPKETWNDEIERAWEEWGRCVTVDGRLGWVAFQQLVAQTVAIDGECLIRQVPGWDNASRFALEIIDADRLDWKFNTSADSSGRRVVMGVEVDGWGTPQAYYIWSAHPRDYTAIPQRLRIPASQVFHVFSEDRARATRGVPWASPVMLQLNMLGRLWTAELAAANWEADKLGIVKSQQGVPLDECADPVAAAETIQSEHATFQGLDAGLDVVFPPLQHPNSAFPEFTRALLKGIAAGLGVAYHSLAADVSDANYSSARVALLDERDTWRQKQAWFISSVCDPIFRAWLEMAIASGAVKLPVLDFERVCCPRWWPRSWEWIDPKNDAEAAQIAIRAGLSTYQDELGAQGKDWRDVFAQRAREEEEAKRLGLDLDLGSKNPAPQPQEASNGKA
jgi:lambda family phage portal protein